MLLLPQAANRLLRPHQPKLKEHGVSLIESSTTGTSVSSVAPYIRGSLRLISTFLLWMLLLPPQARIWKPVTKKSPNKKSSVTDYQRIFTRIEQRLWEQCNISH